MKPGVQRSAANPGYASAMPVEAGHVETSQCVPLSYGQQRLWFVHQLEGGSNEYNLAKAWRLTGSLDVAALVIAINSVVERHESLRSYIGEERGWPVQVILPSLGLDVPLRDLTSLTSSLQKKEIEDEVQRVWSEMLDLTQGPLVRVKLLKLDERNHVLLRAVHHIVTDAWSESVCARDLSEAYECLIENRWRARPRPTFQHSDFSRWQRSEVAARACEEDIRFWRHQLAGLGEPLGLPTRTSRREAWAAGAMLRAHFTPSQSEAVRHLARTEKATSSMAFLAALQLALARWSDKKDIPIGAVVSNRTSARLRDVVGFLVNLIVVRGDLSGDMTFRSLLRRTRKTCLEAYAHQAAPFERVVEEINPRRNLGWNPLFQVVYNYINCPRPVLKLKGIDVAEMPVARDARATFDLKLDVTEGAGTTLELKYNACLFDRNVVGRLLDSMVSILLQAPQTPDVSTDVLFRDV